MVFVYILAIIGGICILGVIGISIMLISADLSADESTEGELKITCALTGERCMYEVQKETCEGCPILEEAEKIGNR